jgi:hypothetical protein
VLEKQKNDFKVDNLKMQLTSNSTLWEQLAEAEKREKILKQELQNTQAEIATMEKVHVRLKDEIKYEQIEKNKLNKFKEQNEKRLHHLEQ